MGTNKYTDEVVAVKWDAEAVRDGILTATHVRLADGWVEVVEVDAPEKEVVVGNGVHPQRRVPISKVLEVRCLA